MADALLNLSDAVRASLAEIKRTSAEGDADYSELKAVLVRLNAGTPAPEAAVPEAAAPEAVAPIVEPVVVEPAAVVVPVPAEPVAYPIAAQPVPASDRQSQGEGKRVSVRVGISGRHIIK